MSRYIFNRVKNFSFFVWWEEIFAIYLHSQTANLCWKRKTFIGTMVRWVSGLNQQFAKLPYG